MVAVPVPWMHTFIDVPADRVEVARVFWAAVTGWTPGDEWAGHPEFASLSPPEGTPYLHIQIIGGPPRIHLDLVGDIERDTARLEDLGATRGRRGEGWQVMASPAGLAFCVGGESGPHQRPDATAWPGGHRSRLVQLSVDVPRVQHDTELAFWQAATGWADEPVTGPEFHRLVHRSQSPLQLLVQRLGSDDRATQARAHLDLGTNDLTAEVSRVQALGAHVFRSGDGFIALQDPVGLPFCVTANDPDH